MLLGYMGLVKKLIVGGSLLVVLGAAGVGIHNKETRFETIRFLASVIGASAGVAIAYRSSDRFADGLYRAVRYELGFSKKSVVSNS